MLRNIVYGLFFVLQCASCDIIYLTTKIDRVSRKYRNDTIHIVNPIIETRRQITKDYFTEDDESQKLADTLTKKALHYLLDERLKAKYGEFDFDVSLKTKILLDSILDKFRLNEFDHFSIKGKLEIPSKLNLILIPYLIWTRTTENYDDGTCDHNSGRNYAPNERCYWTRAQAYLFLIDRQTKELVYYKYNQWDIEFVWLPFEKRITRSFKRCSQPLLRKLG